MVQHTTRLGKDQTSEFIYWVYQKQIALHHNKFSPHKLSHSEAEGLPYRNRNKTQNIAHGSIDTTIPSKQSLIRLTVWVFLKSLCLVFPYQVLSHTSIKYGLSYGALNGSSHFGGGGWFRVCTHIHAGMCHMYESTCVCLCASMWRPQIDFQ